ncbi:MAG: double-strand break repair helicase AddA [Pseudomonadota bacterium]|mgnify:CR=1 FL=1
MTASVHGEETTKRQRLAADPSLSAFVSANAGSGKTRVLTNRVARLLLNEVDPSTILCITFTKAAAAEMADRLFKLLGDWALSNDAKLQKELADLDGDRRTRSAQELARARRLFARALETPGGLKIQTIHSFCESVLKRFPLEAGVAPGFAVIEEGRSGDLKRAAIDQTAACDDSAITAAFERLLSRATGKALRDLLGAAISDRRKFARAEAIGWQALGDEVAPALGVQEHETVALLLGQLFEMLPRDGLEDAHGALDASGGNPQKYCAAPLRIYLTSQRDEDRFAALSKLFLDSKGEPRGKFGTKATDKIDASIEPFLKDAQQIFLGFSDRIRAAEALADTRAFFAIIERCFAAYDSLKSSLASLDFDDLISKTRALLRSDGGAAWVLYKLDMGLAHILLDEAQDTGPDAWSVIEAPLDEFFSGAGVRERARTFFAVGDQKQSIYSFQGADAALFQQKQEDLGKRISAAQAFENVPLRASFRTTSPVLQFVDAIFTRDEVIENVSDIKPLLHYCTREGAAGLVELWPLAKKSDREKPNPWDAPLDAVTERSPPRMLADEIAALISGWLTTGEALHSRGRAIEPGDIMILVQSRGPLFSEMIRALGAAGVPVAGADKIKLMDDQGVLDLVSYARAALFEGDDLSLAEILKSPFFNISEDGLYDLAANRVEMRLWDALRERRGERAEWAAAYDEISAARAIALHEGAAAFFTYILEGGEISGWRRLAARLGLPSREPIEELLRQAHEFELREPRSLRLFLDALVKSGAEISRDASESGPTVRVMTAHKAKGLEANIVFLIDAHRPALTSKIGLLLSIKGPQGDALPVLALEDSKNCEAIAEARDTAKRLTRDEYRRLLYVAATRARDRLYICGYELGNDKNPGAKPPAEKTWHALAEDAFDALGEAVTDAGPRLEGRARAIAAPQSAKPQSDKKESPLKISASPHECLYHLAAQEMRPRRLSPSQLVAHTDYEPAYSPARGRNSFLRGKILHRLLELLPEMVLAVRLAAAGRLLANYEGNFTKEELVSMRDEALRVLSDPLFAEVFAPGALAEAAIGGRAKAGAGGVLLSGQIDRLAIFEDRILVVDYKTNRPPPTRLQDVPLAYLAQMAAYRSLLQEIYPGRKIETALLWTYDARLMALPDEALDRARELTLS